MFITLFHFFKSILKKRLSSVTPALFTKTSISIFLIEIFSKKGSIRANHYHKKDEHFCYILKGEILFFYRNRKKGSKLNYKIMKKGDLFFTTYDQDHLAYFLKTTHFLSYSSRKRSKFDYENDLVRLNMDKEKKVKEIISKYK